MRYLFFISLFLPLKNFAQKAGVFHIDNLPSQGILLDKGWKWHAGDNPDFAKADFDDSDWESIDPTKLLYELPQIRKANYGWFRLNIAVDSSIENSCSSLQP